MTTNTMFKEHSTAEINNPISISARVVDDFVLLGVLPLIASCGLIYEYALSHYAGLVLGKVETAIFIMIGIMIMSAGLGSLLSNRFKCAYTTLAWVEVAVASVGLSAIFIIPGSMFLTQWALNLDVVSSDSIAEKISYIPVVVPYLIGFVMGFLIGLEMPLVVRIRESLNRLGSSRNAAIVYAADCIGIAVGTFAWAGFLGDLNISTAAATAAVTNCIALLIFFSRYRYRIVRRKALLLIVAIVLSITGWILNSTYRFEQWEERVTSIKQEIQLARYASQQISPAIDPALIKVSAREQATRN